MRLVDDQGVVGEQVAVALDLREQDTVGHQLDEGVRRHLPAEAHLVAHEPPEIRAELRRDPRRHAPRRDPPGLRMADHRTDSAARSKADLRKLGALPRAGGPDHQGDRMDGDGARDRLRLRGDRQVRGDAGLRHRCGPRGAAGSRGIDRRGWLRPLPGARAPAEQLRQMHARGGSRRRPLIPRQRLHRTGVFGSDRLPAVVVVTR